MSRLRRSPVPRALPGVTRRGRLVDAGVALAIMLFASVFYISGIDTTAFHQDESRWLNRAHYLTDLLDPFGPTWNDQYLTRGQPPVGSYMMGAGLLLQGRDLDTNNAYDFRRTRDFNSDVGAFPVWEDLAAGRRTNSVLGAFAAGIVYLVVRTLTNPVGGVVGALFLVTNPLQTWHNRLALADTTLTLTLALLLLGLIMLVRRPSWPWAIAIGVLIGLGGANKLTPMALSAPLAAIGAVLLLRGWWDRRHLRGAAPRGFLGFPPLSDLSWMLVSVPLTTMATFVAVYPYLWPDPIGRTIKLIEFRRDEMANQYRIYPKFRTDSPMEALDRTIYALGEAWSSTRHVFEALGNPSLGDALSRVDIILATAGLLCLAVIGAMKGLRSPELIVAAVIAVQTGTIILNMRVDFERYYLPILLGFVVSIGCCVGYAADLARRMLLRRSEDLQDPRAAVTGTRGMSMMARH